jgi:hypothetical protein
MYSLKGIAWGLVKMAAMDVLKMLVVICLFYSAGINIFLYTMPADAKTYLGDYTTVADKFNMNEIDTKLQAAKEQQTKIPILDMGALVFYSGNLIADLFVNFIIAIPEMITLLVSIITNFLALDIILVSMLKTFILITSSAMFIIFILQLILNIRAQSVV